MKRYKITFTERAWNEHQSLLKSNKRLFDKIAKLIENITVNPFSGLGKPEPLKYRFSGIWSRRIDGKHRMIYRIVDDQTVLIIGCKGHYDKK
jgi:toxin YoeB